MRTRSSTSFCLLIIFSCVLSARIGYSQNPGLDDAKRRESVSFLTEGVDFLPQVGAPGPVLSFGKDSFPVVLGKYDDVYEPVVVASFVGSGRVLAFGHTDYCNAKTIKTNDSSVQFYKNAIFWIAGKSTKDAETARSIRILVPRDPQTAQYLNDLGFNATSEGKIGDDFDVVIAGAVAFNDKDYDALDELIRKGGGFLTCGLGWGWSQLNPTKSLVRDHKGNSNFSRLGIPIAWTQGFLSPTAEGGYVVKSSFEGVSNFVDGNLALDLFLNSNASNFRERLSSLTLEDTRQLLATITLIYAYLPKETQTKIDGVVDELSLKIVPSSSSPIRNDQLLERLALSIQVERYIHRQASGETLAEDVPALPAAADFPGSVPENAKRLDSVKIPVKTAVSDWVSTGLYAAPGEVVTVNVEPQIFAKFPRPFKVRIGVHKDSIENKEKWTRYPEITVEKTITGPETKVANPFGGNVYIVVPRGIGSNGLGVVDFEISGAVAAPYFVRDVTSLEEWKKIREFPAPWAELQGSEVILTVPSKVVRSLDNPQALLETWDRIIRLEDELASGPFYRERPERITCDREISAGYMHSGYPVMTHMDVEKVLVDNERLLTRGDWGFFHEFGHNHQNPMWTFNGSVEVTVNYFTLYVMEKLCGLPPELARDDFTKENRLAQLREYVANGAKFSEWKQKPFLALNMTVQLRNEFGWEPFIRTISEYKRYPADELPKSDSEKRDQWMIRLSKNTGKNLAPFFEKWGVPISQEAIDAVQDLPVWLPEEFSEL